MDHGGGQDSTGAAVVVAVALSLAPDSLRVTPGPYFTILLLLLLLGLRLCRISPPDTTEVRAELEALGGVDGLLHVGQLDLGTHQRLNCTIYMVWHLLDLVGNILECIIIPMTNHTSLAPIIVNKTNHMALFLLPSSAFLYTYSYMHYNKAVQG